MIRTLRRRITLVLSIMLMTIVAGIEIYLFLSSYYYSMDYEEEFLQEAAAAVRQKEKAELYQSYPVYVFEKTENGWEQMDTGKEAPDTVWKILTEIGNQSGEEDTGMHGTYRYLSRKSFLVLLDTSGIRRAMRSYYKGMIWEMAGVFLTVSAGILVFSVLMARWLTRPAQKAFERQRQFVADAGHELKTPISVIRASAQRLEKVAGENKWLFYILEESRRMGKLLEELLTLARVENPETGSEKELFDLSRAVTGMLLPYESEAYENGIEFGMDIPEGCMVRGEEEHLKQAVLILLDNAMHHVLPGGSVRVKMEEKKGQIKISVANTGEPIPVKEQKLIFQRFYRSDKSRSRKENRYGLGLPIAQAIMKRHGGRIEVVCQNGETIFRLIFQAVL